ncbi:MAG: ABC transporter ATP-binding protein [Thermaerobacterales bacterium]
MSTAVLEGRDLHKSFRNGGETRHVLRGTDLHLVRGELVVLLGPSGSGKSTLLSLAAGLTLPSAGSVLVEGRDLALLTESARRRLRCRRLGLVFQTPRLLPYLTALQNLLLMPVLAGQPHSSGIRRARYLLDSMGLGDREGDLPVHLSGGERQRAALARALMNRPAVVLADEPTASLDWQAGREVIGLLAGHIASENAAALIVTHDERLMDYADRVFRLADGRLVTIG